MDQIKTSLGVRSSETLDPDAAGCWWVIDNGLFVVVCGFMVVCNGLLWDMMGCCWI